MEFVKTARQVLDEVKAKVMLNEEERYIKETLDAGKAQLAEAEARITDEKAIADRIAAALKELNRRAEKLAERFAALTTATAEQDLEALLTEQEQLILRRQALLTFERYAGHNLDLAEVKVQPLRAAFGQVRS